LLVTADAKSRTYGSTDPVFTASFSGFVNGDTAAAVAGAPAFATTAVATSPAGADYPILITKGTLTSANYIFSMANGLLSVGKASLGVIADDKTKVSGDSNPPLTASYSGFKNGETPAVLTGSPVLSTTALPSSPAGLYPITVGTGTLSSSNYSFSLTHGNLTVLPPLIARIHGPVSGHLAKVDEMIAFTGSFVPSASSAGHTASWRFESGMLANPIDAGGTVAGTAISLDRSFTMPGVYATTLRVTAPDGHSASTSIVGTNADADAFVVVYDPNGSFVTGGGWLWSPAGAYPADGTLSGRANFGFVSKYKKGANTPDGNTEFQFNAGGLEFKSSAYQWLAVAGSRAQFKGVGAVNGLAGFGFMLTAMDGDPKKAESDKFRIKIWDVDSNVTIYDNQIGSTDDSALGTGTNIQGGSIVIHSK
jgi:hypothetical protein